MSSMSPVLGNDMKVSTFWASIDDKFHQNPNVKARIPLRKLKSHWQILNRTCTKFAGCHFRILRQNASGLDKDGKATCQGSGILSFPDRKRSPKWQDGWRL
ncbi:hypothetical protein V8B55DRAFT_1434599 [Mucor lusitanicus]